MSYTDKKIQEAIDRFGQALVDLVLNIVGMSDEDGAYALFTDYGMHDGCECVKFLYWGNK